MRETLFEGSWHLELIDVPKRRPPRPQWLFFAGFGRGGLRFGRLCGWGPQWAPARRFRALVELVDPVDLAGPAEVPPHISHAIPCRVSRDVA